MRLADDLLPLYCRNVKKSYPEPLGPPRPVAGDLYCLVYIKMFVGLFCTAFSLLGLLFDISIYLLTAIGLTPGGDSTVHIYKQTIHRTTQLTTLVGKLPGIRTQSGQTKINDELTA